jgi:hypothetical protein
MRYYFEVKRNIGRCSTCPIAEKSYSGDGKVTYYCGLSDVYADYDKAHKVGRNKDCKLREEKDS